MLKLTGAQLCMPHKLEGTAGLSDLPKQRERGGGGGRKTDTQTKMFNAETSI
jgi:hypothetical protein